MFRCTDCNAEYKIKPDYCDCGNNIFEELPEKAAAFSHTAFPAGQIASIIIFIFCLILAIIPWTIPDKKHTPKTAETIKTEKPAANIPDIDKLWNDTPQKPASAPRNTDKQITQKSQTQIIVRNNKPATAAKTAAPPAKMQQTAAASSAKPVKTPAATKPVQKTSAPKTTAANSAGSRRSTATTAAAPVPKTTTQHSEPQKPVMDKTEFENYKNSIRLALLSKLDLVKITGKGECAIKFSLTENGKLLNRGFIYQSNNRSLNDQIYLMLMRLPVYKTPPKGYNGEVIKLKFYIDNGAYEISFID